MRFLQKRNYTIIERNYRPRNSHCEVDLIGWEGNTLVFIEVKTRSSEETGSPERAVHIDKQRRLTRAAEAYLRRAKLDWDCVRFDVVTVIVTVLTGNPPAIELFRGAFRPTAAKASHSTLSAPEPSNSYR